MLLSVLGRERALRAMEHVSTEKRAQGWLATRVEHPVDRDELEQALREVDGIVEYGRNSEILYVRYVELLEVAVTLGMSDEQARDITRYLKQQGTELTTLKELLTADIDDITVEDVRRAFNDAAGDLIVEAPAVALGVLGKALGIPG